MKHLPWKPTLLALASAAACASPKSEPLQQSESEAPIPYQHKREIVERDGKTYLWAGEDDEWFEVTDARIDPVRFQFGIGKDSIASIDAPEFVSFDDPRLTAAGITRETPVLGVQLEGVARAYPVNVMDMHEVVNDDFGGESYAVLW